MDVAALQRVEADLVAWGLLKADGGPAWSRRLRGSVMREAARLAVEEQAGRRPEGHPLAVAVRGALATWDLPEGAAVTPDHERFLVAVELAALPPEMHRFVG